MIDIRSDTVTLPTEAMRAAMAAAEVGDDVYGDDPTVNRLQELAAKITGKEAALFLPSGTMGNQLAILCHTKRGDEAISARRGHVNDHEAGAAALLSGVSLCLADPADGILRGEDIRRHIRPDDIHCPPTTLVCTENALAIGKAVPLADAKELYDTAKALGLSVHMDGARLFNAAAALNLSAADIAQYTDSVMFCLSKGLSAPVGSMLCGSGEFIQKAIRGRKILGGAMRQSGILAAAGILALTEMTGRLKDDHENAALLAGRLQAIPGVRLLSSGIPINMVFFEIDRDTALLNALPQKMLEYSIKINPGEGGIFRFVTHRGVSAADAEYVADTLSKLLTR